MKTFEEICRMSQKEVKSYMDEYLRDNKYNVINKEGFLYAKGDIPVLLVAHMDTVHHKQCKNIVVENGRMSSPEGIGGDDRCGIFIIMNIVNELRCSVLLCEDEEIGAVGATKFIRSKYMSDVVANYIVEFDRRGNNDAVFYSCNNKKFTDFICDNTGFKEAYGSFSDISVLAPALKIAAVNLSSGYYKAHTTEEYVIYDEMLDVIDTAKALIKVESEQFEYVKKTWSYNPHSYNQHDFFSDIPDYEAMPMHKLAANELDIELEVVWYDSMCREKVGYATGRTKAEAWYDFFTNYIDVSFNMITDYNFT